MSSLNVSNGFVVNIVTPSGNAPTLSGNTVLVLAQDKEADATNPFSAVNMSVTLANLTLEVNGVANPTGLTLAVQPDTVSRTGDDLILEGTAAAPEPTSLLLAALAAAPLALGRRRRVV